MDTTTQQQIAFVLDNVTDYQTLVAGIPAGTPVYVLDSNGDVLSQMAAITSEYSNLGAIHLLSHGSEGALDLGTLNLDTANIDNHAEVLSQIGSSLSENGDILLYGCNVAQNGVNFIGKLALATGADIAASTDTTGSSDKGGDWTLEAANGSVNADTLNITGFSQLLGTPPSDQDFDSFTGYPDPIQGSITLGGINYTDTLVEVMAGTELQGFEWDATLFSNGFITSNTAGLSEIDRGNLIISSTDLANDFTLDSFKLGTYSGNGNMAWIVDIIGYQGGVNGTAVASVTGIDLTSGYADLGSPIIPMLISYDQTTTSYGSANDILSYTRQYVDAQYNGGGLISFTGSNWSNIDTIVIKANSTQAEKGVTVGIDSLDFHNTAGPAVTSATYNALTNVLSVTGTDMTTGDTIDATKLTLTGEENGTYTLAGTYTVSAASATGFTVTLDDTDARNVEGLLNYDGTVSVTSTTYNLAAAANWESTQSAGADTTGNGITVSNTQNPAISGATYDAATGVLTVTGSNMVAKPGATNDISVNKLTLKGEGNATYTLTSSNVEVTDSTGFSVTLNATDKAAINQIVNKDGTISTGTTTYNLSAAMGWNTNINDGNLQDTTNTVTASNVAVPTITSSTYDASTGALVVTGTGFSHLSGATNDIVANKFTFTGEDGAT